MSTFVIERTRSDSFVDGSNLENHIKVSSDYGVDSSIPSPEYLESGSSSMSNYAQQPWAGYQDEHAEPSDDYFLNSASTYASSASQQPAFSFQSVQPEAAYAYPYQAATADSWPSGNAYMQYQWTPNHTHQVPYQTDYFHYTAAPSATMRTAPTTPSLPEYDPARIRAASHLSPPIPPQSMPSSEGSRRVSRSRSLVSEASSVFSVTGSKTASRSISPSAGEMSHWGRRNDDGSWSCAYPGCTSKAVFHRGCDLRKHFRRHTKSLFCRFPNCSQATEGGFSSKKDRARHEASHNPQIVCEWPECGRLFSRMDNMKDHVRRIHKRSTR